LTFFNDAGAVVDAIEVSVFELVLWFMTWPEACGRCQVEIPAEPYSPYPWTENLNGSVIDINALGGRQEEQRPLVLHGGRMQAGGEGEEEGVNHGASDCWWATLPAPNGLRISCSLRPAQSRRKLRLSLPPEAPAAG